MLQNSFYAISGTFYTLLNNTDLYLSYFILSYVFLGHNDSVEWGLTVLNQTKEIYQSPEFIGVKWLGLLAPGDLEDLVEKLLWLGLFTEMKNHKKHEHLTFDF